MIADRYERDALYQAILDAPEDDLPRLVYADWLEEYGGGEDQVRAKFIRAEGEAVWPAFVACYRSLMRDVVSLKFCGFGREDDDPRRPYLRYVWASVERLNHVEHNFWMLFRRGFVGEIRAQLATLLDHGAVIVARHPVTRMVAMDREPCNRCGSYGYHWHPQGPLPCDLPDSLWHNGNSKLYGRWAAPQPALEALYAAVLNHCREQAARDRALSRATTPE